MLARIETERDIDTLRQIACLLDRENERLHRKIETLVREVATLKGADAGSVQLELEHLRSLLAQRDKALFGRSSEKRPRGDGEKATDDVGQSPSRGHGPTAQKRLPVVEVIHELDVADQACPVCGGDLKEMAGQYEESEEITVVERQFVVRKHKRKKYRCQCNACVETALPPVKLQEGGRYSPEFAVEVAASKYLDHIPLERQVRIMAREGLSVTSQTLWDQVEAVARQILPTYEAIKRDVLSDDVVGADETRWPVRNQEKKDWYAWCASGIRTKGVYFEIDPSRGGVAAARIFKGYRGVIVSDGYAVYEALARGDPNLTIAHCWAHVRRKFLDIQESFPLPCQQILDLIDELFLVDRSVRDRTSTEDEATRLQLLAEARDMQSREIIRQIERWVMEVHGLPESGLGKAVSYMTGLWKGLTLFLSNPKVPLDNNATERAIRGPVVGRKNFYGARSKRGTEVAAIFYSLFETAKLRGVEPKAYLLRALLAALQTPGTATLPVPEHEHSVELHPE